MLYVLRRKDFISDKILRRIFFASALQSVHHYYINLNKSL